MSDTGDTQLQQPKKGGAKGGGIKKKGKNKNRKAEYGSYLHLIMKQIDPNMTIKADAMLTLDRFVGDFVDRLIDNGCKWAGYEEKTTFKAKHAQAALQTMLTGKLQELAVAEANKALTKYTSNA